MQNTKMKTRIAKVENYKYMRRLPRDITVNDRGHFDQVRADRSGYTKSSRRQTLEPTQRKAHVPSGSFTQHIK